MAGVPNAQAVSPARKLWIATGGVFWFLLIVFFALASVVLLALPWWVTAAIAGLAIVVGVVLKLSRGFFWGRASSGSLFWMTVASFLGLSAATAAPVYYLAYAVDGRPAIMPLAMLSDGQKQVVFQGMQHIGSEGFYKSVVYDLEKALSEGYVLFYEGVNSAPGHPEDDKWFADSFAGGGELNKSYSSFADACGLTFQLNYFTPLTADAKVHPERHITADVTHTDMKQEYDRLAAEDPGFVAAFSAETGAAGDKTSKFDPLTWAVENAQGVSPAQKQLIGFACRGILSIAYSGATKQEGAKERVLLHFRNRKLAERIVQAPQDRIYITYGGAHLPGLIKELQKIDPAWKVQSLKWMRVMSNPENIEGAL